MFLCISKSLHSIYFVEIERLFLLICWKQKKENWVPQKLSWYSMSWVFISQKLKFLERTTSLHMYLVQAGDSIASGLLVDPFKYICKTVVLFLCGILLFFFAFLAFFCDWGLCGWIESSTRSRYKATSPKILKIFQYGFNIASFPHQSVFWAFFWKFIFFCDHFYNRFHTTNNINFIFSWINAKLKHFQGSSFNSFILF